MQIEPKLVVMVRWKALQEPLLASLDDMNHHEATLPPPRPAVLPPFQNAVLTAVLVGLALGVAALLPNASAQIFALTGATGVCCIGCEPRKDSNPARSTSCMALAGGRVAVGGREADTLSATGPGAPN